MKKIKLLFVIGMSALILVAGSGVSMSIHSCITSICKSDIGLKKSDCCSASSQEKCSEGFLKAKCCLVNHLFSKLVVENSTNNNSHVGLPRIISTISFFVENFSNDNIDFFSLIKIEIKINPLILFQRLQI